MKIRVVLKYLNLGFSFPLKNGDLVQIENDILGVYLKDSVSLFGDFQEWSDLDSFIDLCNNMSDDLISKFEMEMKVRKYDKDSKK